MPVNKVRSKWVSGDLQFLDSSGNVIFTISAANQAVTMTRVVETYELATTAAALSAYGISALNSTAAATKNFTLTGPTAAGQRKSIIALDSTGIANINGAGAETFQRAGAAAAERLSFSGQGGVDLVAVSTSRWGIAGVNSTAVVSFTTSST